MSTTVKLGLFILGAVMIYYFAMNWKALSKMPYRGFGAK